MKTTKVIPVILIALVLLIACACAGGGTPATPTPTPTPTLAPTPTPAVTPTVTPSAATGVEFASCDEFELSPAVQDMLSIQVTAPSSGYVVLTASGYFEAHVSPQGAWAAVSVSTVSGRADTENETRIGFPDYMLSGVYTVPFSLTCVIPVLSGDNQFYMVGSKDPYSRIIWVRGLKLTAVFVPTRL